MPSYSCLDRAGRGFITKFIATKCLAIKASRDSNSICDRCHRQYVRDSTGTTCAVGAATSRLLEIYFFTTFNYLKIINSPQN